MLYEYKATDEEREFLNQYNIRDYDQTSIAADIVLLSLGLNDNKRKIGYGPLQVLLIKRENYPFKDKWSLPGGFCIQQETCKDTAIRVLRQETAVNYPYLEEVGTYSGRRDPRGWIVSDTYMGVIDKLKCRLRNDDEAWDAKWFNVSIKTKDKGKCESSHQIFTTTEYELHLDSEDGKDHLVATTICQKIMNYGHFRYKWTIMNSDLGFDHGMILTDVITSLKRRVQNDLSIIFEFVPELFTLGEAEAAYKAICNIDGRVPNFRRRIEKYVIETDAMANKASHRPAKLYMRNFDMF